MGTRAESDADRTVLDSVLDTVNRPYMVPESLHMTCGPVVARQFLRFP